MATREDIKSGDLLIWHTDKSSALSRAFLSIVRTLTRSEYGHVGIAWRLYKYLFVVEGTLPFVRIAPIKDKDEFYYIPVDVKWTEKSESFLLKLIGKLYSLMDGIRAYFGKTVKNDEHWQCAEIVNEFYREHGIDLGDAWTPTEVVKKTLEITGKPLYKIAAVADESTFTPMER